MADGLAEEAASCSQGLLGLWRQAVGMVVIKEIRKVVLVAPGMKGSMTSLPPMPKLFRCLASQH